MSVPDLEERAFLRPQVKIEPLVSHWYAWSHLVAPVEHDMNLAYRQLPLLQSFVSNPSVHIAANRDPKLFGGPFVSLPLEEVPRVKALLEETTRSSGPLLRLADDLKRLDKLLQERASGYSLNELYAEIPESLRGRVELVYDPNNHPQMRVLEEILYDDETGLDQHSMLLTDVGERERHFFMSTPRFAGRGDCTFPLAFRDPCIDALASMRSSGRPFGAIAQALGVKPESLASFRNLFTTEPPRRLGQEYQGSGVRVRYFGHACMLLESSRVSILVDPMLAFEDQEDGRLTFNDLPPRIDYVLITHNHQDHCSPEILLQLRHRVGRVLVPRNNAGSLCDPSMKLLLRRLGFADVAVLEPFDTVDISDGRITSLPFPGEHVDLDIHSKQAAFVSLCGRGILFLADSDGWDPMLYRHIMRHLQHRVDAVFLGMECHGAPLSWLYGPLLTRRVSRRDDESRRLSGADSERAWAALEAVGAPRAYVYAMGQEPWLRFIMGLEYTQESIQLREAHKFVERCRSSNVEAKLLYGADDFIL
jgi:L-ascorbate metabolism protein UlaG (beta-lactamase superfamily)